MASSSSSPAPIQQTILSTLLQDESLHDVTFQCNDSVKVSGCRKVLAAGSSFLRTLLCGSFREGSEQEVSIDYCSGSVLKSILQYIHTDNIPILEKDIEQVISSSYDKKEATEEDELLSFLQDLLQMHDTATFLDLPGLTEKLRQKISLVVEKKPEASLLLLENDSLQELAWKNIRSQKYSIVTHNLIQKMPASVIEKILKDKQLAIAELGLCEMLQKWASAPDQKDRTSAAKAMAKNLRLELIDPVKLDQVVSKSGLVEEADLLQAYKKFALAAREEERDKILPPRKRSRKFFDPCLTPIKIIVKQQMGFTLDPTDPYDKDVRGTFTYFGRNDAGYSYRHETKREIIIFGRFGKEWWIATKGTDDTKWYAVYEAPATEEGLLPPKSGWVTSRRHRRRERLKFPLSLEFVMRE